MKQLRMNTLCIVGLPSLVTFTIIGARFSDSFIPLEIMAPSTRLLAATTIELSGISSNRSTAEEATRSGDWAAPLSLESAQKEYQRLDASMQDDSTKVQRCFQNHANPLNREMSSQKLV
jgi:hypothetical protein